MEYHELSAKSLLTLGSYVYLLNVARWIADRLVNAGLLGEMCVGIICGTPLAGILEASWEQAFMALGYLGLVIMVFEGGLCTKLDLLRRNILLSVLVAITGLAVPMGISILLFRFGFKYTFLEGFAAGAALCSTSLGTTFRILSSYRGSSGPDLSQTRIGTVLLSAAILDDVVGLILASIIPSFALASESPSLLWPILRPVLASLGLTVVIIPATKYVITPIFHRYATPRLTLHEGHQAAESRQLALLLLIVVGLSAMTSAAYYAGTSILFGAYLAGCILASLFTTPSHDIPPTSRVLTVHDTYENLISPVQTYILSPFFFSSIGGAIPFLSLFKGKIIWRGIIYSILMYLAKAVVGVWTFFWPRPKRTQPTSGDKPSPLSPLDQGQYKRALYPSLFLSLAMVARGEIALLVAQLAKPGMNDDSFFIVMWAIVVCTVLGPVSVGWVVRYRGARCVEGGWS